MQLNSQLKFLLFLKNKRLKEFRNCNSVGKSNSGGKNMECTVNGRDLSYWVREKPKLSLFWNWFRNLFAHGKYTIFLVIS